MKRTLSLLVLLASLSAAAENLPPASTFSSSLSEWASTSAASPATAVQQFTLSNGMQLIVQPDRRAPTAVHMLWLRVGAMEEVDGTTGVAHALEHMMFKGSQKLAPGEFSRRVAALGGQENAFTNRDYTGYYQQIPSNRLREVMELEADRFAHNQWPDAEFTKEIEVIKEERRMRTEDNPRGMLFEQLSATVFQSSPYRRPVVGWMSDLDSMTAQDVRDFHQQWYVPANAAIVIAGDVDVAQVKDWAEATYGQIPARASATAKPRQEPQQLGMRRIAVKQPAEQAYVAMAYRVPSIRNVQNLTAEDKDALALLVLSAVLDGYDGARLERGLVQGKDRVADSADSSAGVMGRGPGLFILSGIPAKGKTTVQLEKALRAQVEQIAQSGVQATELERVKTQWMASQIYERDSVMGQAQSLGNYWVMGMPVNADELLLKELMKVSAADVQSVAKQYFGEDQLTIGSLVPQPRAAGQAPRPATAGDATTLQH
jgi:zinc protease